MRLGIHAREPLRREGDHLPHVLSVGAKHEILPMLCRHVLGKNHIQPIRHLQCAA